MEYLVIVFKEIKCVWEEMFGNFSCEKEFCGDYVKYLIVMGFFFMIRIFECFFLGMFDFFGNSY